MTAAVDPLDGLGPDEIIASWSRRGLADLSDADLVDLAARHLAVPRQGPANSFVLHAPLELMARASLLRFVEPQSRERARQRIAWVAAAYDRDGPAVEPRAPDLTSENASLATLRDAIDAGDLDTVDRAAAALGATATAEELVSVLADLVVARLAAAGHGSIFLYHLPRLVSPDPAAGCMARGLLREIAREPAWTLTWMDDRQRSTTPTRDLRDRLCRQPNVGDPGSNFIYPTMSMVERMGLTDEVLGSSTLDLPVSTARHDLLRVAAWSMLQDDPASAPYGWSHALTMPQATLAIARWCADPDKAVAVAATFVLGFRATLGRVALDPSWQPPRGPRLDAPTYLDAGPDAAASEIWHAAPADVGERVRRLATFAALHGDAHLAKYTLACIDASRDDPGVGRLYLAAAAFLAGWWRTVGADDQLFAAGA
jgi:hypothetical protein